jgi:hypothetical protein
MNRSRKEQLKENIDKLDPQEHSQIFDVIKRYTQQYTQTGKSIFVSTDMLPLQCLEEIERLVAFYLDQRKTLTRRQDQ